MESSAPSPIPLPDNQAIRDKAAEILNRPEFQFSDPSDPADNPALYLAKFIKRLFSAIDKLSQDF